MVSPQRRAFVNLAIEDFGGFRGRDDDSNRERMDNCVDFER